MVVLSYKGRVTKNKKIEWKIPLMGLEKNKLEYFLSTFCSPLLAFIHEISSATFAIFNV